MPFSFGRFRRNVSDISNKKEDEFHEYKVIIEEIKQQHPDLPQSAIQKMAVEKFSNKEKCSQNPINELFAGMSNLRFGKDKRASWKSSSKNDDNTKELVEDRRQSLNPRISVANIDARAKSQSSIMSELSKEEDSLENSLEKIEASAARPRKQLSKRGMLKTVNSTKSELVDVQEDEVLQILETSAKDSQSKNSSRKRNSITDDLPDEIKVALDDYDRDDLSMGSDIKSQTQTRRRSSLMNESIKTSNASFDVSIDSANFEGDFSAWASKSSKE